MNTFHYQLLLVMILIHAGFDGIHDNFDGYVHMMVLIVSIQVGSYFYDKNSVTCSSTFQVVPTFPIFTFTIIIIILLINSILTTIRTHHHLHHLHDHHPPPHHRSHHSHHNDHHAHQSPHHHHHHQQNLHYPQCFIITIMITAEP